MTPQAVATAAKAIAPQNPPAQAPAASTIDFSQLLGGGFASLLQAGNSNTTPPAAPPQASPPKHDSSDTDSASANLAGTACATAPQQQTQAATPATAQATTQGTTPGVASPVVTPAAALVPALPQGAATNGASGTTSGQGAQTVPGAAAVEARVVAGAPTYLSQPSAMLAGLWHHAGTAQANDAAQDGDAQPGDASASDPAAAPSDASAAPPKLAAAADAAGQDAHGGSDSDTSLPAPDSIPGQAVATAVTSDPTAAAVPAPSLGAHQVASATPAAQTSAAATALPMPVHVLPAAEQVALSLRQAVQSGTGRIEIQLKPASLGAISVKLDVTHDGHISAVISADRSDTLNLLKQDLPEFAAGLARRRPQGRQRQPQLQPARRRAAVICAERGAERDIAALCRRGGDAGVEPVFRPALLPPPRRHSRHRGLAP